MKEDFAPFASDNLEKLIETLFVVSTGQMNIERSGDRRRIRYYHVDTETGVTSRKALELPPDDVLVDRVEDMVRYRKGLQDTIAASCSHAPDSGSTWAIAAFFMRRACAL